MHDVVCIYEHLFQNLLPTLESIMISTVSSSSKLQFAVNGYHFNKILKSCQPCTFLQWTQQTIVMYTTTTTTTTTTATVVGIKQRQIIMCIKILKYESMILSIIKDNLNYIYSLYKCIALWHSTGIKITVLNQCVTYGQPDFSFVDLFSSGEYTGSQLK